VFSANDAKIGRLYRPAIALHGCKELGNLALVDTIAVAKELGKCCSRHARFVEHGLLLCGSAQAAKLRDELPDGARLPPASKVRRPLTQASIGEIALSRARRVQPAILIAKA
jgi:hypothetical protein